MTGAELLNQILYVLIVGILTVVTKYVVSYLNEKKQAIKEELTENEFQNTMLKAVEVIERVIETTSQTYVDALKKQGKFDEEAQTEALKKTVEDIMVLLPSEAKALIEVTYNDVDKWVKSYVESYLRADKKLTSAK